MSHEHDHSASLAHQLGRTTAQRDHLLTLLRRCMWNPDLLTKESGLRSDVEGALAEHQESQS